jgi:hypothetical protein
MKNLQILNNLSELKEIIENLSNELKEKKEVFDKTINFINENKKEFSEFIENSDTFKIYFETTDDKNNVINRLINNNKLFIREKIMHEIEAVQLKNAIKNIGNNANKINLSNQLFTQLKKDGLKIKTTKETLIFNNLKIELS